MNKFSIYIYTLLSLAAFSACDEDFTDWAEAQSNPQEEQIAAISASFSNAASLDVDSYEGDSIDVVTLGEMPEGYSILDYGLQLTANGNTLDVPYANWGTSARVDVDTLALYASRLYNSRQAVAREVTVRITPSVLTPTSEAIALSSSEYDMTITPGALPASESAYYILGDFNGWDMATAVPFEPVAGQANTYSAVIEVGANCNVKIFPQSGIDNGDWDKALGAFFDGDAASSGLLDFTDESGQPGSITIANAGKMDVFINMQDYSYTIRTHAENMYIIGSMNGWNWDNWDEAYTMIPVTQTEGKYWSMQYFNAGDEFKFSPNLAWGNDFGYSADILTPEAIALAELTDNGGNIKVGKAGWYIVVVTINGSATTVDMQEPNVYLFGDTSIGAVWEATPENLFTVPDSKEGDFVSPAVAADGVARMCVVLDETDWWRSEFTVTGGTLVYRANLSGELSDNGYECAVTTGQNIHINFMKRTGSVE